MSKKFLLFALPIVMALASFISLFPLWLGDLFSHFRMFWMVSSLVLLISYIIFFTKKMITEKYLVFVILTFIINSFGCFPLWQNSQTYDYLFLGSPIIPTYSQKVQEALEKDSTVKKLLLMNVLSSNTNYEEVKELIKITDADFVVLIELNQNWEEQLKEIHKNYPYQFLKAKETNFGMGIYSKTAFIDTDILLGSTTTKKFNEQFNEKFNEDLKKNKYPIDLDINKLQNLEIVDPAIFIKDKIGINILALHSFPPISVASYKRRNNYLTQKIEFAREKRKEKLLVVGDFNCSPFSVHYKELLMASSLKDSQQNFGFQPTWNSAFPFLMQTQLDHVWHSENIEILHRQTLPIIGSDHKAVLVVFR